MSHNSFGRLFRVTTWGESHGPAIGCVVDGCPPGLPLREEDIQVWLNRRRPGTGRYVTQRCEADKVRILSGVFTEDEKTGPVTLGTPVSMIIENTDQRSKDYESLKNLYRPGHADYTYAMKYGIRDHRGGGRASARETAMRVAAGAVARKILGSSISLRSALVQIGPHAIDRGRWDWEEVERNPFWCPDAVMVETWSSYLDQVRKEGSSTGAVVEVVAEGVPVGWGAPVYGKLDADLAEACMSVNAVKAFAIGAGFQAVSESGGACDEMEASQTGPVFLSNHNGGVLGGISTGQPLSVQLAFKATSSILKPRRTFNKKGENVLVKTEGRHDPCVGIRGAPVAEAMMACVLADHKLRHRGQTGR